MSDLAVVITVLLCVAFGHVMSALTRRFWARRNSKSAEAFSDLGVSVEVDCRGCGQFNRVPSSRLRDRPKCGRCKERLMPGKRVVLCRVRPMDAPLRVELDAVWKDEDRLWQSLADHVALETKAKAEAKNPGDRVVN